MCIPILCTWHSLPVSNSLPTWCVHTLNIVLRFPGLRPHSFPPVPKAHYNVQLNVILRLEDQFRDPPRCHSLGPCWPLAMAHTGPGKLAKVARIFPESSFVLPSPGADCAGVSFCTNSWRSGSHGVLSSAQQPGPLGDCVRNLTSTNPPG